MILGFNRPYLTGNELVYIQDAVEREKLSGNGHYTKLCHEFFTHRYGFKKVLLTQSCTDALEMAAILLDIKPGDEIILPSFTFVSSANAFLLRGAKLVFADCEKDTPNLDINAVERLVSDRTKAVVAVHYAGVACDMDPLMELSSRKKFFVIEDAAQAIESFYKGRPLGSIGHLACFSFHETKNVISGEGGMLVVNDERFVCRSEIIWEKGTNRSAFSRGEVERYSWMDIGSSFLPSELTAAFLWAQLEEIETIQRKRLAAWEYYQRGLEPIAKEGNFSLPVVPKYATNNAHMFYLLFKDRCDRQAMMEHLKQMEIQAIFHYLPLHSSPFFESKYSGLELKEAQRYSDCILRLPMFASLTTQDVERVIDAISQSYTVVPTTKRALT